MSTVTCNFGYYPTLRLSASRISQGGSRTVPEHELVALYSASRKSFHPLLKHLSHPAHLATVIRAFDPASPPQDLWEYVCALSTIPPRVIFPQLAHKIYATRDVNCRGNKWIRRKLRKDLRRCQYRLTRLQNLVIKKIVANEESERDPRLLASAYIVKLVMEWEEGSSVKKLLDRLG